MKIVKIELQNINSLKSETPIVIDFEDAIFQDVGLYAITGATGAGKTTILDAITIALYQEVPRFNKPNIKAGLVNVVSYGATDAMSRVTFTNKNTRYEAQWSMRLASRTGKKLTKPDEAVRLKNLNSGKIIAEKKTDFKIAIEEITQLSYPQFLRSVMLAQGEFAAFLSASAKEKGTLLEQITGEGIYKKIGEAIGAKKTEQTKALEQLQSKINTEDLLSDNDRNELQNEQEQIALEISALTPTSQQLDKILQWHETAQALQKEKTILDIGKKQLQEEKEARKLAIQSLEVHEKATPFKERIDEITRTEVALDEKRIAYINLTNHVTLLNNQVSSAHKEEKEAKGAFEQKETAQQNWLPKLDMVTRLDSGIKNIKQQINIISETLQPRIIAVESLKKNVIEQQLITKETEKEIEVLEKELSANKNILFVENNINDWNTHLTLRKNKSEHLQDVIKQLELGNKTVEKSKKELLKKQQQFDKENFGITTLKQTLKKIEESLVKNDLTAILQTQEKQKQQQENYKNASRISKAYLDELKKSEDLKNEIKTLDTKKEKHIAELSQLIPNLELAKTTLQDAENILELQRTIQTFDEERKKLTPDIPCPLCGSSEHPYIDSYKPEKLSESQKIIEERRKILDKKLQNRNQLEIKIATISTSLNGLKNQFETCSLNINAQLADFKLLQVLHSIENNKEIQLSLNTIQTQLFSVTNDITLARAAQNEKDSRLTQLTAEKEKIAVIQQELIELTESIKNQKKTLDEKNNEIESSIATISALEITLQAKFTQHQLQLPKVENTVKFISTITNQVTDHKNKEKQLEALKSKLILTRNTLRGDLKLVEEKSNENSQQKENIKISEIQLQQHTSDRKNLLPLEISTEQKRKKLHDAIVVSKEKAQLITNKLQKFTQEQGRSQKEYELLKKEGSTLKNKLKINKDEFLKTIKDTPFSSLENVKTALLPEDKAITYQNTRRKLEDTELRLKIQQSKWDAAILDQKTTKDFEQTLEMATKAKLELENLKVELLKKTGSIKQRIVLDDQIRARNKTVINEITKQAKIVKKWTAMLKIIGGSKDAFNTYVQRLTLQNLIHLANVHLYKLNKRYSLQMQETYKTGEELNFMLVDHYQADEMRLVDTSSGGEKFLISLSLALGLSDLASHNVPIQSLFIDEGFGTLDNHTLETVIATLETLQAQGKMIGIISHVENLKERIATQIQVIKKNNGVSELLLA